METPIIPQPTTGGLCVHFQEADTIHNLPVHAPVLKENLGGWKQNKNLTN